MMAIGIGLFLLALGIGTISDAKGWYKTANVMGLAAFFGILLCVISFIKWMWMVMP